MIPEPTLASRRILIVDDNQSIHRDFRTIFAPATANDRAMESTESALFGPVTNGNGRTVFEIDSALQGEEGLDRVRRSHAEGRPYAVAFVDMRMPPGWNGIDTIARIWEVSPALQVVICTAFADYSWDEINARLGRSDRLVILNKPFDTIEVLQLTYALAAKWNLQQQAQAHLNSLEQTVAMRTEELRESEERYRLITENAADLISIVDARGNRLYSSPSHESLLGLAPADLVSIPAFDLVHPEDRERVTATVNDAINRGLKQRIEFRMRHKERGWRLLESQVAPFPGTGEAAEGALLITRDVTEARQAEHQSQLIDLQLRQAQKLEAIGRLAAGIAHEINTPIQYVGDNTCFLRDSFQTIVTVLSHHVELLCDVRNDALTPEQIANAEAALTTGDVPYLLEQIPAAIQETLEGVERVNKIVQAMKAFSHPGGKERAPVDVNKAVETTTTVARNEWKYVADLKLELDPHLPEVPCFLGDFNQAILNLVVNAAHAIRDAAKQIPAGKGTITVSTRRDRDHVEVRVSDTGTGIPEAIRPRIFEPFFTTKGVGQGTGQGLSLVYSSIVNKHGGTVSFETESGKGTTFILRLPLAPGIADPAAPNQTVRSPHETNSNAVFGGTVAR